MRRDFHQTARHVHGVAGCGDVLMVAAAEAGRIGPECAPILKPIRAAISGGKVAIQRSVLTQRDRTLRRACSVIGSAPAGEQDHGAVAKKTRDHAAARVTSLSTSA